eukprot:scaffold143276_cov127-Phaeocystis_antarctica.AAC.1
MPTRSSSWGDVAVGFRQRLEEAASCRSSASSLRLYLATRCCSYARCASSAVTQPRLRPLLATCLAIAAPERKPSVLVSSVSTLHAAYQLQSRKRTATEIC